MSFATISQVARLLGCKPRDISDAFYSRELDDAECPVIGRFRVVPEHYIAKIRELLVKTGKLGDGANKS